jgi:hypothetical protein
MLLLANAPFNGEDRGAQAAATLTGRVELIGEDLEARGVDGGVHPAVCFTEEGVQRMGDGFLSTLVSEGGMRDISSIVGRIMAHRGLWGESDHLSQRLLTEILLSVHENRPIVFNRNSLEEIHLIFKILDYLGLDQWQESLEGSLPPMPLTDTPDTVFSLNGSELELAPHLDRFRALKYLIIQGFVSQNFLDSLPPTLCRLSLPLSDMEGRILTRKETALAAVAQNGRALEFASAGLRADKEVVMAAVARNGLALRYASAPLRGDKEVVMGAVAQDGWALFFASDELRGDKEVVMGAVAQDGLVLRYASAPLRGDKEVVMGAVAQAGWALFFASDELRGDKEVVMGAVAQDGLALRYASAPLRGDKEVVMGAVAQNGLALFFASDELRGDREVVMAAVAQNGLAQNGLALRYASAELRADKDVIMAAVARNGWALEHASDELRADEEVVMAARSARTNPYTG